MSDKFTVLVVLAVTTLLAASAGYGHPTVDDEAAAAAAVASGGVVVAQETTSTKHGLRGWLMTAGKRHHEHVHKDCKHGEVNGVLAWVKNKFRPAAKTSSTTTAATTTTTTTTSTDEPDEYGYQSPEPAVDNGDVVVAVPAEPYETPDVEVPSENNGEGGEGYATDEPADAAVPYPITESPSEFADPPAIDVRSTF